MATNLTLQQTPLEDVWALLNKDIDESCILDPLLKTAIRNHVEYLETRLGIAHADIMMCLEINKDSTPEEAVLWLDKQWHKQNE